MLSIGPRIPAATNNVMGSSAQAPKLEFPIDRNTSSLQPATVLVKNATSPSNPLSEAGAAAALVGSPAPSILLDRCRSRSSSHGPPSPKLGSHSHPRAEPPVRSQCHITRVALVAPERSRRGTRAVRPCHRSRDPDCLVEPEVWWHAGRQREGSYAGPDHRVSDRRVFLLRRRSEGAERVHTRRVRVFYCAWKIDHGRYQMDRQKGLVLGFLC